MNNKTVEIVITESSFYFNEGEIYRAIQDDDGFVIQGGVSHGQMVSDGEAELTGEEHE